MNFGNYIQIRNHHHNQDSGFFPLLCSWSPLPLTNLGNHWSTLCHFSFVYSRVSDKWNHTVIVSCIWHLLLSMFSGSSMFCLIIFICDTVLYCIIWIKTWTFCTGLYMDIYFHCSSKNISWIARSHVKYMLKFIRYWHPAFQSVCTLYIPTGNTEEFKLFQILSTT